MHSRRTFVVNGFAALTIGLLASRAGGLTRLAPSFSPRPPCDPDGAAPIGTTHPVRGIRPNPESVYFGGYPFHNWWLGDDWVFKDMPFHGDERRYPNGIAPEPTENVDIAIIGGGLSGLACAYLYRQHHTVLFEMRDRFGGVAAGESWRGNDYSMGGAYFITPDEGSFLERLYHRLGVDHNYRFSPSTDDPAVLNGAIQPGFWDGAGRTPQEQEAFRQYRLLVQRYVDQYPEIPLVAGEDNQWIRDLDQLTLKQHITQNITVPIPDVLAAAIQAYCFSSFNLGWEELSAASGWNFIAAEEFGRWVLPGGNAGLTTALWEKVLEYDHSHPLPHAHREPRPNRLRAGCPVVDVRSLSHNQVKVTYRGADGVFRAVLAKKAVICCPKHICRNIIADFQQISPQQYADNQAINTNAYIVANVLLNRRVNLHYYDMFLLGDGHYPEGAETDDFRKITDALNGTFARRGQHNTDVITCYLPLSFAYSRFTLALDTDFKTYAESIARQLDGFLGNLGVTRADVAQVRLTRWGHSMPLAVPTLIASGLCERFRVPLQGNIYFVGQDNWALPAVETCLIEAEAQRQAITAGL